MGEINPHIPQHDERKCTTCHKVHRASVNYCMQGHTDAVVLDGWLSYTDSKLLETTCNINGLCLEDRLIMQAVGKAMPSQPLCCLVAWQR